jgi:hypothetical protein
MSVGLLEWLVVLVVLALVVVGIRALLKRG